ncbi:MAG: hypothetical protein MJ236_00810 [Clostridia bacterium]|nr:hypothetical protein [Clostridia bacterium]
MQSVSQEYKDSMKGIGRNRGYIKILIGIVNSDAQKNIRLSDETEITYFANTEVLQNEKQAKVYATCENDFSTIDGNMYFLPSNGSAAEFYNNGIVVSNFMEKAVFSFSSDESYDVIGFTIDFGDNYPIDFEISNGNEVLNFTDNKNKIFSTELGLHNVTHLEIIPKKMKNGENSRLRIYSFMMGIANTFTNENTISYNQNDYVSAISDSIPSSDVEIVVANYDQYFNPDNDNSAFAFFEEGQEVKVSFGYDVDGNGNIEWLPETITHLKEWSATDKDATFKSTDIFDYMSGTYYKGEFKPNGISAYELAEEVFLDAEIAKYRIDAYLRNVIIYNPIPAVSHTEALQIIANACRCALYEDRDGTIVIQSDFIPKYEVSANGEYELSNVANVGNDKPKVAYAIQSKGFSSLSDSDLLFANGDVSNVGYVSYEISDSDGNFTKNPIISVKMEADYSPSDFYIVFRNNAPRTFAIKTFANGASVENIIIENPNVMFSYGRQLNSFDYMEIEFLKGQGNDRITVDKILFGAPTDYTIERNMMSESPTITRDEKIKSFVIGKTMFKENSVVKTSTTKFENIQNGEHAIYFSNACYDYSIRNISGSGTVKIKESSCYRLIFTLTGNTTNKLEIETSYKEYDVDDKQTYVVQHNINGIEKTWNNPLISNDLQAKELEEWLADYLLLGINYEFSWRGDPRIDANDLFYMELKSGELANIRGYQNKLSFNGAWSGDMKARKVVV